MARALLANNISTTLTAAITTTGATTFTVASVTGMPVPSGGTYFYCTLLDSANVPEIVKVTGITTLTLTCVRAQDGTAARTFLVGASVKINLVAAVMAEFATGGGTATGTNTGDQTIPTTLPASDVFAWAKASVKPTYTYSEVGAQPAGTYATGGGSATGTNTGDNAANTNYASDYRAANFVAGTDYLTPTGSAASLTSFPTLNQNTTGGAGSVAGLTITNAASGIAPNSVTQNQIGYANTLSVLGQTDGGLYSAAYSSAWMHQIYGDFRTGQVAVRGLNSGAWGAWRVVLDSSNFSGYAPTLTGGSASGTWGINITGNAATVTGFSGTHSGASSGTNTGDQTNVAGYSRYFPTNYIGGVQTNPQTYFNNGVGLNVAMTAAAGTWTDTLWINGYSGADVPNMVAIHTSRQATPRMWLSTQGNTDTAYGTMYEVISSYNIASQSVSYAATAGNASTADSSVKFMSTSHAGTYWNVCNWDGTYWYITSNHGSPVRVGYADSSGSASSASSAVTLSTGRTNWASNGVQSAVVGMLGWKNYGNNHTIFDASAGTAPDGSAVSNTTAQVAWGANYPTLMGWNGASTYGVRVDSARYADSAGSAPASDVYAWAKAATKPSYSYSEVGAQVAGSYPTGSGTCSGTNTGDQTNISGTAANVTGIVAVVNGGTGANSSATAPFALKGANADITSMTALASVNGGQLAGLRNRIVNGEMRVDQRSNGAALTLTGAAGGASQYCVDRWIVATSGTTSASCTTQRITSSTTTARLKLTTTNANVGTAYLAQRVESANINDLYFQNVVCSVIIACQAATTVSWALYSASAADTWQAVGTSTAITNGASSLASGTWSATATETRFSTGAINIAGGTTGLMLVISRPTSATSQTLIIGEVQLEKGSVATAFEQRPVGMELALCQQYYQVIQWVSSAAATAGSQDLYSTVNFPTQMRVAPTTVTKTSGTFVNCSNPNAASVGSYFLTDFGRSTAAGAFFATYTAWLSSEL